MCEPEPPALSAWLSKRPGGAMKCQHKDTDCICNEVAKGRAGSFCTRVDVRLTA